MQYKNVVRFLLTVAFLMLITLGLTSCGNMGAVALNIEGQVRTYNLHLPAGYSPDKKYPLMVVLHGDLMNGWIMEQYTQMDKTADKNGFIVVYPNALRDYSWWCCGKDKEEIQYIKSLLVDLKSRHSIDSERIYFSGLSGGGFFLTTLSRALTEQISAVAFVASTDFFKVPGKSVLSLSKSQGSVSFTPPALKSIPLMLIIGTKDFLYSGNLLNSAVSTEPQTSDLNKDSEPLLINVPAEQMIQLRIQVNKCTSAPKITTIPQTADSSGTSVQLIEYQSEIGNDVAFYKIENGGHHWPNALFDPYWLERIFLSRDLGPFNRDFDTNQAIWDFVSRYSLHAAGGS